MRNVNDLEAGKSEKVHLNHFEVFLANTQDVAFSFMAIRKSHGIYRIFAS